MRLLRASESEKTLARKLRADGLTYMAIGEQLGRPAKTISRWCDPIQSKRDKEYSTIHRDSNREHMRTLQREWRANTTHGRASSRSSCNRRRGRKNEWYTNCPEDISREQAVYLECERMTRETGVLHHVDHIWPLNQGGPHLWFNLQIIPADENLSKSDTYRESDQALYVQRLTQLFNQ